MSSNKDKKEHGLGQCITEFIVSDWHNFDFCSKIATLSPRGSLVILRDPKKVFTHSNYHRYMSDTAYMPHYLHSEYVGESVLHEMPGLLCKSYGKMRRDKGLQVKRERSRKRSLSSYWKSLDVRRKFYNISKKLPLDELWIDKFICQKMNISWQDYTSNTLDCISNRGLLTFRSMKI